MAQVVANKNLHRIVATAIVYNNSGEFLIVKRSPDLLVFPNVWAVPGGGIDQEDYINTKKTTIDAWYNVVEGALKREVMEEVGIEIKKPEFLLDLIFIRPDNIPVLTPSYFAEYDSGEIKLDESEHSEYKWIRAENLKEYEFIEGIPEEIEEVDEILKKRKDG